MKCIPTSLSDILIIEPQVYQDFRGTFVETYRKNSYSDILNVEFVQDNVSYSKQGTLRGLHYQYKHPQAKLVYVLQGAVLDVILDIRTDSPSFGQHVTVELSADHARQCFIPVGFAHGFLALSSEVVFAYKCSDYYYPVYEQGIAWNDPALAIDWGIDEVLVSSKDLAWPRLADLPIDKLL